eukprot:scaffold114036_cov18-Tisochrysis_lutea.AAC.2
MQSCAHLVRICLSLCHVIPQCSHIEHSAPCTDQLSVRIQGRARMEHLRRGSGCNFAAVGLLFADMCTTVSAIVDADVLKARS